MVTVLRPRPRSWTTGRGCILPGVVSVHRHFYFAVLVQFYCLLAAKRLATKLTVSVSTCVRMLRSRIGIYIYIYMIEPII